MTPLEAAKAVPNALETLKDHLQRYMNNEGLTESQGQMFWDSMPFTTLTAAMEDYHFQASQPTSREAIQNFYDFIRVNIPFALQERIDIKARNYLASLPKPEAPLISEDRNALETVASMMLSKQYHDALLYLADYLKDKREAGERECPDCEGEGEHVFGDDKNIKCKTCDGKGKLSIHGYADRIYREISQWMSEVDAHSFALPPKEKYPEGIAIIERILSGVCHGTGKVKEAEPIQASVTMDKDAPEDVKDAMKEMVQLAHKNLPEEAEGQGEDVKSSFDIFTAPKDLNELQTKAEAYANFHYAKDTNGWWTIAFVAFMSCGRIFLRDHSTQLASLPSKEDQPVEDLRAEAWNVVKNHLYIPAFSSVNLIEVIDAILDFHATASAKERQMLKQFTQCRHKYEFQKTAEEAESYLNILKAKP